MQWWRLLTQSCHWTKEESATGSESNVRFSSWMSFFWMTLSREDSVTLCNLSSRQLPDSGKAANQQHFWERVSVAYKESENIFGKLHWLEDEIISEHSHVDPSKVVSHEWKKLRKIWKSLNAAQVRFTQSGTHDKNFFAFCIGKVKTYHFQKYLDMGPHINATVKTGLPEECAMSSDGTMGLSRGTPAKKRKGNNDLTDAIYEYNNYFDSSEISKQKLVDMEKEEEQQEKAERRLEADHLQKKHNNLLEEWEKMQSSKRLFCQELCNDGLDATARMEVESGIAALAKFSLPWS